MLNAFIKQAMLGAAILALAGCVHTNASFRPEGVESAASAAPRKIKSPDDVIIRETDVTNRPYRVIGVVEGYGRSITLLSSDPTRADVDEALRVEAARQGADAVIQVKYVTERTGLASRGLMTGTGRAVVFLN
ncbi:hypothetical protein [Azospirillum sp. sgz302134]